MGYLSQYLEQHPSFAGLSARRVSQLLGVGINTALGLLEGRRIPEEKTLIKIAEYLHPAAPDVRERELARLRELVLLDTPFELPERANRLTLRQRNLLMDLIDEMLPAEVGVTAAERETASNVVQMSQPKRVQKAAYDPPDDE